MINGIRKIISSRETFIPIQAAYILSIFHCIFKRIIQKVTNLDFFFSFKLYRIFYTVIFRCNFNGLFDLLRPKHFFILRIDENHNLY